MSTPGKIDKPRLIFGLLLIILILTGEIILEHFHLPAWPAFMCMVFFFLSHMDRGAIPKIIFGGLFGIAYLLADVFMIKLLAPYIGVEVTKLAFVALFVFLIVAFGPLFPSILNDYAFTYFIFSALALKVPGVNLYIAMAVELVGGSILIAGVIAIVRFLEMISTGKEARQEA